LIAIAAGAVAENEFAIPVRQGRQDRKGRGGEGDDLFAMVLGSRAGDGPKPLGVIDFHPAHSADLIAALPSQH
jgi:hypothetical protein